VSSLSGYKVMIQNVHVQFRFCISIYIYIAMLSLKKIFIDAWQRLVSYVFIRWNSFLYIDPRNKAVKREVGCLLRYTKIIDCVVISTNFLVLVCFKLLSFVFRRMCWFLQWPIHIATLIVWHKEWESDTLRRR